MIKEKIRLTPEQTTLLIPLYSKAGACPDVILKDEKAHEILASVDYDFEKLDVPTGTNITVCMRARRLDEYTRRFLQEHPEGVVLHLGCGLDSRCQRVQEPRSIWYDLDFPPVIELRRKFYPESDNYRLIAASVTDPGWMERVEAGGKPVIVIAEGLMMYLHEEEVKELLLGLHEHFPGCLLAFDAFSELTARSVHRNPSLKATGAVIHWGIDEARRIETWGQGFKLLEEWYFTQSEQIPQLKLSHRLMFRVSGMFAMARKAHRLLYFRLGE